MNDGDETGAPYGGGLNLRERAHEILSLIPGAAAFTYDLDCRIQVAVCGAGIGSTSRAPYLPTSLPPGYQGQLNAYSTV